MTVGHSESTTRPFADVAPLRNVPLLPQPMEPHPITMLYDPALARYRAGLEEIGRLLGWAADTMAAFAEDVTGCPWAECGWPECDAMVAAYRDVLDRCEALATRRWSVGAQDAGGLPLSEGPLPPRVPP